MPTTIDKPASKSKASVQERIAAAVTHIEDHMRDTPSERSLISSDEFANVLLDIRGELVRSGGNARLDAAVAHIEKHMRGSLTGRSLISSEECTDVLLDIRGELVRPGN